MYNKRAIKFPSSKLLERIIYELHAVLSGVKASSVNVICKSEQSHRDFLGTYTVACPWFPDAPLRTKNIIRISSLVLNGK